ncbi:MAG TPA: STAS domain-containing protein [Pseudonocardiaceae bacterium]|nr:STAS domain-containing protein [Pseudonocardiaceae bacterium]
MSDRQDPDTAHPAQAAGPSQRADALVVTAQQQGNCEVLTVSGEIDLSTEALLRDPIARCLHTRPRVLVVDLSAVTFMGSSGLSALREAQDQGAPHTLVRVVVASRAVLRPIHVTGVERMLSIYPTLEQALAAA